MRHFNFKYTTNYLLPGNSPNPVIRVLNLLYLLNTGFGLIHKSSLPKQIIDRVMRSWKKVFWPA